MSIGSHLLTKDNLKLVKSKPWRLSRPLILDEGMRYYDNHSGDVDRIVKNLKFFGLPSEGNALDAVLTEIVAHYFEKLFVLVKNYEAYWIIKNRVKMGDSLDAFHDAQSDGKAVFMAQSHFGATYLLAGTFAAHGLDLNAVGNYPEPAGSMLLEKTRVMTERYGAGRLNLINVAEPDVDVPFEMMRHLAQKKIVSNVFDEHNQFCRPITLLGKRISGGSGMDLILRSYTDERIAIVTPFLIRTSGETFRCELDCHYLRDGDIVQSLFGSLERRLKTDFAQWYFINEVHHNFIEEIS